MEKTEKNEKIEFVNRTRQRVINHLTLNRAVRNAVLLDYLISKEKLTKEEKADSSPDGKKNQLRSRLGTVLSSMVKDKTLSYANGFFTLIKEKPVAIKEEEIKPEILLLLKNGAPPTKKEIFTKLEQRFQTNRTKTKTDDENLHNIAGRLLKQLTDSKQICVKNGRYSLPAEPTVKPLSETEVKKAFIEKLLELGGEHLEIFTANIFDKYLKELGYEIIKCEVTGGANDYGIDCVIEATDPLKFKNKIFFQVKCYGKSQVTEKDVREFCGAVHIKGGSHGVYVTTSTFHNRAIKIMQGLNNFTRFDKDGLFSLARHCEYGVKTVKNGYLLDETVFG